MRVRDRDRPLVALATSAHWPELPPDDRLVMPALARLGVDARPVIWTDPAVDWSAFDLIVVRSCWDYHDDLPRWLAWLDLLERHGCGPRLCNPAAVLRWNGRKTYLNDLQAQGIAVIATRWVDAADLSSWESFEAALRASPWDEIVCKPAISAGALATFRWHTADLSDARQAFRGAQAELVRRAPVLLQPFLPEVARGGEWSLLFFDGCASHAVLKRPAPGDFRVQEKHGGTARSCLPPPALTQVAHSVLAAAARVVGCPDPGAFLYARVDLVETARGALLVELELLEPALFLGSPAVDPDAATRPGAPLAPPARLAAAIARRIVTKNQVAGHHY